MTKKRGLGKGLDALIPVVEPDLAGSLRQIPVNSVRPNPRQPRQLLDDARLEELASSIREHGVVQPIVVRPLPGGQYELIAGERRWRACLSLGEEFIPALVRDYDEVEAAAVTLIENIQREDLNPLEEAMAYRRLIDEFGMTQEELARKVGKSRSFIANTMRLLGLPDEVREMLGNGQITAGHARAVLSLEDADKQIAAAREVVAAGLNVRDTEELVRRYAGQDGDQQEKKGRRSGSGSVSHTNEEMESMEAMLGGALGTAVHIRSRRGGTGVIEICYESRAQLEEIISLLLR
ncbi:ParB/RepB/Spo0J family partition protein [Desulfofundulus thermobenzoicus]|uniref:ParB/RepB/Spo0J family partition protein n=1 Tax=Desulfofundulus thermobenzoicus TaxID=29376 RepID=A0A6N7IT09_9FIRM|nr:ParB/RepB/Spo0J family partition protein [Desulfofundulus thermobenzoicus]MQL53192.1 ParB/RepB/Spo0J family partition protein [Desulfofundulus thermobenzoicus]